MKNLLLLFLLCFTYVLASPNVSTINSNSNAEKLSSGLCRVDFGKMSVEQHMAADHPLYSELVNEGKLPHTLGLYAELKDNGKKYFHFLFIKGVTQKVCHSYKEKKGVTDILFYRILTDFSLPDGESCAANFEANNDNQAKDVSKNWGKLLLHQLNSKKYVAIASEKPCEHLAKTGRFKKESFTRLDN
jgi:hypothetical protein